MAKIKYFYNPQKLDFEKVGTSIWSVVLRVFGFLSASTVVGGIMAFGVYSFLDSPKERALKQENEQYRIQIKFLHKKVAELGLQMADLHQRDANIYRAIFEAEPLDINKIKATQSEVDRYRSLEGLNNAEELVTLNKKIDVLGKQVTVQSKSFDELIVLAKNKTAFLASIPAIQPVTNEDLTRIASGYGYRIHPIFKTHKFHAGIDFTAPKGTPIYATGNGVISTAENSSGYGNHVVIKHGFGYASLYAHMSRIKARVGQKVTRGELIGYVGSTGTSTAPHLHYEVVKGANKVNPINYFFKGITEEEFQAIRSIASREGQSFD